MSFLRVYLKSDDLKALKEGVINLEELQNNQYYYTYDNSIPDLGNLPIAMSHDGDWNVMINPGDSTVRVVCEKRVYCNSEPPIPDQKEIMTSNYDDSIRYSIGMSVT